MTEQPAPELDLVGDFEPETEEFLAEVLRGFASPPRSLPSKYLYDERGSELFERICELDEYYLTRTELAILEQRRAEIAQVLGPQCLLIEFGSGSSRKTRVLLDALKDPAGYVPIDISREQLTRSARALARRYPALEVLPVCADYTRDYHVPEPAAPVRRRITWFPGSTIGNFEPANAQTFLKHCAQICGMRGGVLIGVDLHKDTPTLEAAYDDRQGVTAEFELNILARMNRELGANFALERFRYEARYNPVQRRVEMYLVSLESQEVRIGKLCVQLAKGERILTEHSYKYTLEGFRDLAATQDLAVKHVWTDANALFSVQYLTPE
jgi:dimethylhistidine N-methyltransferase